MAQNGAGSLAELRAFMEGLDREANHDAMLKQLSRIAGWASVLRSAVGRDGLPVWPEGKGAEGTTALRELMAGEEKLEQLLEAARPAYTESTPQAEPSKNP